MNQMSTLINTALVRAMDAISSLRARLAEERGQDLLEYALLGGLLAAAITAAAVVALMTGALEGMADGIADCIDFDNSAGSQCGPF
jgi:Flp pilus assembly pilin Flp